MVVSGGGEIAGNDRVDAISEMSNFLHESLRIC